MKTLLIVYHSRTGGAAQMARAALDGARVESAIVTRLLTADEAGPEELLAAHGYIFACPENLAAMSGAMKEFFDLCYYPVLDRLNGRYFAGMICAGSDGENAWRQMKRICTGWRLREVAPPLIVCTHAQTQDAILATKLIQPDELRKCADLGAGFAAGLACGIY